MLRIQSRSPLLGGWLAVATAVFAPAAFAQSPPIPIDVVTGTYHRLELEQPFTRFAVSSDEREENEVLRVIEVNQNELLLWARKIGRASLFIWLGDGTTRDYIVSVKPDLTLLQQVMTDIDPSLEVEMAPDRDAIVLRGVVPTLTERVTAEQEALKYLRAGQEDGAGRTGANRTDLDLNPIVGAGGAAANGQVVYMVNNQGPAVEVINRIRVLDPPQPIEFRIQDAIHRLGATGVEVTRLMYGAVPDSLQDTLMLTGDVSSQIELIRTLEVAARMFLGEDLDQQEIEVVADESGALAREAEEATDAGFVTSGFDISSSGGTGFGSSNAATDLGNRVTANLGRGTVVSVANGRLLSFIDVRDLPQIRVSIRLYEINRTELLAYASDFTVLYSDFDQPELLPSSSAIGAQGLNAARVGSFSDTDVQSITGFLADGFTQELQISGGNFAVDATLNTLESRGIARSLAHPSLTVLSGEQALFQVGGEIPVPQSYDTDSGGSSGVFNSVVFEFFGIQLGARPLVGLNDEITMDVVAQVSRPDPQLTTVLRESTGTEQVTTSFQTRSLGTSARLADGETLLIGGLLSASTTDNASFTPWMEEIPVLGWLFKRFNIQEQELEMIVVVNPTIVRDPIPGYGKWIFPGFDLLPPPNAVADADADADVEEEVGG